jgi:hypothetical protein
MVSEQVMNDEPKREAQPAYREMVTAYSDLNITITHLEDAIDEIIDDEPKPLRETTAPEIQAASVVTTLRAMPEMLRSAKDRIQKATEQLRSEVLQRP